MAAPLRRRLALCGLLAPMVLAVSSVLAEAAQPGYSPIRQDLSTLAALDAHQPWIMMAGMVGTGLLLSAFSLVVGDGLLQAPEAILLLVGGLATMGAGLLRIDCSEKVDPACAARSAAGELPWHDGLHNLMTAILAVVFVAAPAIAALRLRARPAARPAALMSLLASLGVVVVGALYFTGVGADWAGLMERGLAALALAWVAGVAVGVRRLRVPEVAAPMALRSAGTGSG